MVNELTISTIRTNGFKSIYTILNTNKVSGTTIYAGFPNKNPSFPCYIIQPVLGNGFNVGMDTQDYNLNIEIEFWCRAEDDRKDKIDEMKDNVMNTIITNQSSLSTQNISLQEGWFNDDMSDTVLINDEKYHTGSITLSLKLK